MDTSSVEMAASRSQGRSVRLPSGDGKDVTRPHSLTVMSALTFATAQLLRVLPRERITRLAGSLADHRWSDSVGRAVVGIYSRVYDVDLDDCVEQSGWSNFDAFFTRALRDGARPVDPDGRAVVSPSDGRVDFVGPITADSQFPVKGSKYRVEDLVGSVEEARRYVGGTGCVIYLSPRDYHRVHSPVDGVMASVRSMPGDYLPVNEAGVRHFPELFVRNRRVAIAIDAPPDSGLGRVTVVMVAAMIVGRITVTGIDGRDVPYGEHKFPSGGHAIKKGEELGVFRLGSTAVLLLEPSASERWVAEAGAIRMGRALCMGPARTGRSLRGEATG